MNIGLFEFQALEDCQIMKVIVYLLSNITRQIMTMNIHIAFTFLNLYH